MMYADTLFRYLTGTVGNHAMRAQYNHLGATFDVQTQQPA
jgi:hypothetical protein